MANLGYYAQEIDRQLRQVSINEIDIGMRRVNVLPIPDGELESSYEYVPAEMELTVTGNKEDGSITIAVEGTAPNPGTTPYADFDFGDFTLLGTEEKAIGVVKPGTYVFSISGSDSVANMPWLLPETDTWYPWITVTVYHKSGSTDYSAKCGDTAVEFTVPESATRIEFKLHLRFDFFTDVTASCEIYPFLRLKALEDEPFEPYKPDLQTQIISQQQASARITDAIGMDGSINLFPIDKGTRTSPLVYHGSFGDWYIAQNGSASYIGYASTDSGTTEATEQYRTFYNIGYQFDNDHPFLYGDLAQGTYALSFDVSRRSHFNDCEVYYEVYASDDASDIDTLIATCVEGDTITFDVTAEKPYISIKPTVYRPSGESWENCQLITVPFLRRAMFVNSSIDEYKKSVKKQLAELYALVSSTSGGYNETQVDAVTDNVEEVTQ